MADATTGKEYFAGCFHETTLFRELYENGLKFRESWAPSLRNMRLNIARFIRDVECELL